ncbi:MAG: citrate/2-methylcitrate synthase [Actinomycetota bacterium]
MSTFVRAPEAARRLGVTLPTLYAYVSRGRIGRVKAADGRTSLFDLAEVDALRAAGRQRSAGPPPSIDVQIASSVTRLDEDGLAYRGHRVEDLLHRRFEDVAELLWIGHLPTRPDPWPTIAIGDGASARELTIPALIDLANRLGTARTNADHELDAIDAARRLLGAVPTIARHDAHDGSAASFAHRLLRAWIDDPDDASIRAVDRALVLLADHELATSTLAVRVAASVRTTPELAIVAGLATVAGDLHGSASAHSHRFLQAATAHGVERTIDERLDRGERLPGFGHRVYRHRDPRFDVLLDAVRRIGDPSRRVDTVDRVVRAAAIRVAHHPNVDLALGALTWVLDLPPDAPLFAVARIAGWTAHYLEEIDERPVRFRGLARSAP